MRFNLLDPTHPEYDEKEFVLPIYKRKRVKSSSGEATIRTFIQTKILLFGELMDIELSLADRSDMKYPVLLGRKLLQRRYVVDVSKRNLSFKKKII